MIWSDDIRQSEKNGPITIRHGLTGPNVVVGGYSQSGEGLNAIWRDALKRALPVAALEPRVLILGLGGGGMLREVYSLFPDCTITAIEHDPEMVRITKELKYYEPHAEPEIILSDAREALGNLNTPFDLIAIDMFRGAEPSPHLLDTGFWDALKKVMAPRAIVLVNVAGTREYLEPIARHFTHADMWRCKENFLGMFSV
jgi:spermidine synthase